MRKDEHVTTTEALRAQADETVEPLCESEARFYVEELCPSRRGLLRRIVYLWGNRRIAYFRVNFHDPATDNRIVTSYFVESCREGARLRS